MPSNTYRAVQATSDHQLVVVDRPVPDPAPGQVRIRVEACGICRTDAVTVEATAPGISYPRVPGHEVVGRIDALGAAVQGWAIGQLVGVGFLAGACLRCASCRHGDLVNCANQHYLGIHRDGGYAEVMLAEQHGLIAIPAALGAVEAAPLLCAGLTTFNALQRAPARPGQLVAIHGLGGLGHLAVQYARHMGFHTVAIARGAEKAPLAASLGAHQYIDSAASDPAAALQALGGAQVIVSTVAAPSAMAPLLGGLKPRGQLLVLGGGPEPVPVSTLALLFGDHSIAGMLTGSPADAEDTLGFSLLQNIRATVETVPLEQAAQGYARMMRNEARFRMVLTTGQ